MMVFYKLNKSEEFCQIFINMKFFTKLGSECKVSYSTAPLEQKELGAFLKPNSGSLAMVGLEPQPSDQ